MARHANGNPDNYLGGVRPDARHTTLAAACAERLSTFADVVLHPTVDSLLHLGMDKVEADRAAAIFAFTEALSLFTQSTGDTQLSELPVPLQAMVLRLLLHRSGTYEAMGCDEQAAQDAKGAAEIQSWGTVEM